MCLKATFDYGNFIVLTKVKKTMSDCFIATEKLLLIVASLELHTVSDNVGRSVVCVFSWMHLYGPCLLYVTICMSVGKQVHISV